MKGLRVAACMLALAAAPVFGQGSYPDKPVTFIVPQAAGGANDTIARIVAKRLSDVLKQGMVVENRAGAGGTIGTAAAAKVKPDGYTLLFTADSAHVINPALYKAPGFDALKDFVPIATVATAGYVLVAHPSLPANNVKELVAHAKSLPKGSLTYASAGNGTLNHLIGAMFEKAAGIEMTHVPYKGAAASVADVVGGQVPLSVQSLPSAIGFIKSGKLKVLAVANEKRIAALPDTPAISETFPGFGATPWYGVLAPAGTPKAVIDRMQAAILETLDSKDVQDQLAAQGCEVLKRNAAEFANMIQVDLPRWERVVRETGAKVD